VTDGLTPACPIPLPAGERVLLGHGSGGRLSAELVNGLFLPLFADAELDRLGDAAVLDVEGVRLAFTTDAFVVQPPFFPGGDIGALSVHGTVNDLAMVGARPLALSVAFILEEGFPLERLGAIATSLADAAKAAGVRLVTGDTKVVEQGAADGIFVVTSGIGVVADGIELGPDRLRPGDAIVVSGPVGSHGTAVLSRRAGVAFDTDVESDSAPLTDLVHALLARVEVHALRDATRGGVATVLNELATASGVQLTIDEAAVPVLEGVHSACATLGLDPLYVANEGVCVVIVAGDDADEALATARAEAVGAQAALVGVVEEGPPGVRLRTRMGSTRPLLVLTGDQLPRIC